MMNTRNDILNSLRERARQATSAPDARAGGGWHTQVRHITPHEKQTLFLESTAKRKVIRAGRRGGKTVGIAELAIRYFMDGRRVLYATPTQEQIDTFWYQVKWALEYPIDSGILKKNETLHVIEVEGTKNRIRAKTAWNADTLRGDHGDLLIFDEWQLMNEDAWGRVGVPMLLDNNGDAVFIYTPPSLHSRSVTKADDPRHAAKLFKKADADESGRWEAFHFTSRDNPNISAEALDEITQDMTQLAYEQEILAEDKDESPGALWKRKTLEDTRVTNFPELVRIVVGVDPTGSSTNECGIGVAGIGTDGHGYVLDDSSLLGSPETWSNAVVAAYNRHKADRVIGEKNYGGEMVERTIRTADGGEYVSYKHGNATRGKAVRAEPIAALYERGMIHHVGTFPFMEDEMCSWIPDSNMPSPNRLDAIVWALTELMLEDEKIEHDTAPSWLSGWRG
jgi:hypothetical protein